MINLTRLQDIQLNDLTLRSQYYNYFLNGQIDEAKNLISNNTQLNGKVVNANMLNNLINSIDELQQLFFTDVINVLDNHLSGYQVSIDELIFMSTFDVTIQYEINNFVLYNDDIYYCYSKPTIGTLPTDTTKWIYLGLQGDVGNPALGVNYVGAWESTKTYAKNQMVVYNNMLYIALQTNSNAQPTNVTYWLPSISVEYQNIFVSETEPSNIKEGNIWVQIVT